MVLGICLKKCTCFFRIRTQYRSLLHFSAKKKGGGFGYQALNSQAIKQAMPARNAGIGDCSPAHPSISVRLCVCVSTMHVLPRAPTPHTGPSGLWGERRQVCYPLAALHPSPPHVPLKDSFFLPPAGNQKPWSSFPPPKLCSGNSPKRI